MEGMGSDGGGLVSITVLSVAPARGGKLFAPASVEVDIDGVRIAHLRNSRAACRSGRHRLVEIAAEGMGVNHIVMDFALDLGSEGWFPPPTWWSAMRRSAVAGVDDMPGTLSEV